jgi:uncharacterized surface protein with fasciclin (FAS1) repeats
MSTTTQAVGKESFPETMHHGIMASGLDEVLSCTGTYPQFAPSVLYFGPLQKEMTGHLLLPENQKKLNELLYHPIIPARQSFHDLKDIEKLTCLNNREMIVEVRNGMVSIDGSYIQERDAGSSKGVIHSLDKVLHN